MTWKRGSRIVDNSSSKLAVKAWGNSWLVRLLACLCEFPKSSLGEANFGRFNSSSLTGLCTKFTLSSWLTLANSSNNNNQTIRLLNSVHFSFWQNYPNYNWEESYVRLEFRLSRLLSLKNSEPKAEAATRTTIQNNKHESRFRIVGSGGD